MQNLILSEIITDDQWLSGDFKPIKTQTNKILINRLITVGVDMRYGLIIKRGQTLLIIHKNPLGLHTQKKKDKWRISSQMHPITQTHSPVFIFRIQTVPPLHVKYHLIHFFTCTSL